MREQHLVRAYASYHTAYCLTYTSGETVMASPPWNERFWGYPMPYLDEVRFASRVGCVLVPGVDFQLPARHTFESKLARLLYVGPDRFNLAFQRHTGQWIELYEGLSLQQSLETIRIFGERVIPEVKRATPECPVP